ncbi:hypothetical protein EB001_09355 [bacterium]|nr:hypothetical protein [bacterium]
MAKFTDKKWLIDQYVTQRKSVEDIANHCNTTPPVIISWLNEFSIYRKLPSCVHSKIQCPKCG